MIFISEMSLIFYWFVNLVTYLFSYTLSYSKKEFEEAQNNKCEITL
jgi:hypothetical protein